MSLMPKPPASLIEFQRQFVQQALAADRQASEYPYRQTMVQSQVNALITTFPGLVLWVGADCAKALFERYVLDCPSTSADLNQRGQGFSHWLSRFIKDQPAYRPFRFLPDYAYYEWCCESLKGAADAQPSLSLKQLATARVTRIQLKAQPTMRLITSAWPLPWLIAKLNQTHTAVITAEPIPAASTATSYVLNRQPYPEHNPATHFQFLLKPIPLKEMTALTDCLNPGINIEAAAQRFGIDQLQSYLTRWLTHHWVRLVDAS